MICQRYIAKNRTIWHVGCPTVLRTDHGSENGLVAAAQIAFRRDGADALAGAVWLPLLSYKILRKRSGTGQYRLVIQ